MIPSLKSKKLAEAGIDQWKVQNKAVKALMEKYVWFEAMTVTLGEVRVCGARGAKPRAPYATEATPIFYIVSDITTACRAL